MLDISMQSSEHYRRMCKWHGYRSIKYNTNAVYIYIYTYNFKINILHDFMCLEDLTLYFIVPSRGKG